MVGGARSAAAGRIRLIRGWFLSRPVFQLQARHLPEVPQIARDESGPIRQGDGGDEQIGPADLLEFPVLPQVIELSGGRCVDWRGYELIQGLLSVLQQPLGALNLFAIGSLEEKVPSATENLNT
jgi:hypothetical protein